MIRRLGRRKYKIYAMDLETHNDEESRAMRKTSMWLGCMIDETNAVDDPASYFYNMDEFLDRLEDETRPKRTKDKTRLCCNVAVYIFNLSFEYSFIIPYLLKRGFAFKPHIEKEDEFVFSSVTTKSCSSVWSVELKFGKKNGRVVLRDLRKIFSGSLASVAKSFGLETQKGEIDYTLNRLHGHIVTEEEKEYCFKDTRIIVEILMKMNEKDDKDFWNSISMASYSMKKMLKRGYPRAIRPYAAYRQDYPELGKEESDFLREGVEGGITYAVAAYQFKVINEKIGHCDKHSMHPSSAYLNLFPYGFGTYFKGKPPMGRISACRIRISYDDVRLHSVIKLIGLPFITDKEIVVWDFEIPTMRKCYVNLKVEYIDGYAYKMRPLPWRKYYSDCYNKRLEAKAKGDKFNILYYKLLINSSYGKHLEKPHNKTFVNYVRDDGVIDSIIEDKAPEECKVNAKYTYLPVGSAIPAYSRVDLIESALKIGWQYIVYFDTDSIFFLWNEETEKAWSQFNQEDFLGGWGWEEMIDRAQFTAPKRYKKEVDGRTDVKAAGINFDKYKKEHGLNPDDDLPFDEVNIVSSLWKVQRAYRVEGGTIIEFQDKEMSVQKKYEMIYNKNAGDDESS